MDLFPFHLRLNTQVSLSDRKLTLVRHKISQTKYTVSRSFHQQFLCHIVRLHMFHKTTILINMHCQKSVTNIMNNFEIALKFSARAEKYTESTLGCLRRNTCLTWIALPSFPTLFPPPFLPSFFVQNASTPLGSNLTRQYDEAGGSLPFGRASRVEGEGNISRVPKILKIINQ